MPDAVTASTVPPEPSTPSPEPATQVILPPTSTETSTQTQTRTSASPDKKPRRGLRRLLLAILVLAAVAGAVLGLLALRGDAVDYSKLEVGDCFDSAQSNEIRGIDVEPCSEPHDSEIFFLVEHPAGPEDPYPGKETLVQFAADACLGQPLTDYLGVPLEKSTLKDFEIVPQESAWKDGRRVLVCGLDTGGGEDITGSVKGTRR